MEKTQKVNMSKIEDVFFAAQTNTLFISRSKPFMYTEIRGTWWFTLCCMAHDQKRPNLTHLSRKKINR